MVAAAEAGVQPGRLGRHRRKVVAVAQPARTEDHQTSLVVFDHHLGRTWIVATGLTVDGSRHEEAAQEELAFWRARLEAMSKKQP